VLFILIRFGTTRRHCARRGDWALAHAVQNHIAAFAHQDATEQQHPRTERSIIEPMQPEPDQYDTPWKQAVEHYFPEFMAFYFAKAHAQIDWTQGYTFLDQELQAITKDGELGKRFVDKLVRVTRLQGAEDWIYIHLEVQGTVQAEFAKRMFVYNYRIFDKYDRPVASMAVLADDSVDWKPQQYISEIFDCRMGIEFPVAKLMDYAGREPALAEDTNPFALVTLAHLQTRATRKDPQARFDAKWRLIKILLNRGWDKPRIINLLHVIDWMMALPEHLKQQLWQNLQQLAKEKSMEFVTSFEQIGIDKGRQQGLQEGRQEGMQAGESIALQRLLAKRFGPLSANLISSIEAAALSQIEVWFDRAITADKLADVFAEPASPMH